MSRGTHETIDRASAVAGRILCDGAFVFADPLEPGNAPVIEEWQPRGVCLSFAGHSRGAVSVWAGERFVIQVAANMLGIDETAESARDKGFDALKELLNMIAGNLLTELYGTEPVFELGLPREAGVGELQTELAERACVWFDAEGEPVLFTFCLPAGN